MTRRVSLSFALLLFLIVLGVSLTPTYTVRAATVTVTNTSDAGPGSLRAAITSAASGDTIAFNIAGAGVHTIAPTSGLPQIPSDITIDGYTQPGSSAATISTAAILMIEIDGENAGTGVIGLPLIGGTTVKGLVINRFDGTGIQMDAGIGNVIAGNIIGLNAAGTAALGNGTSNAGGFGILIGNSANNIIGGETAADRNIISGNGNSNGWSGGILVTNLSSGNVIEGNYIGTNITGTAALGNASQGINIDHSSGNTMGGTTPGARNLISGNVGQGINIYDTNGTATNNIIQGNYIGTNATGTGALGNTTDGVNIWAGNNNIIGGTVAGAGNLISGNGGKGIYIGGGLSGTVIQANLIGTDKTGMIAIGNAFAGVQIDGGSNNTIGGTMAARNIISGNGTANGYNGGILLTTSPSDNTIQGNYIGTDITGTLALGNGIGNDGGFGILIYGGFRNVIGGNTAGAGNLISGNGSTNGGGILLSSGTTLTAVFGNTIGTDVTGTLALGNAGQGINIDHSSQNVIGGGIVPARNLISANAGAGISIFDTNNTAGNNTIQGNYIGTNVSGAAALGNTGDGIDIWAANNTTVGGAVFGVGNLISGNGGLGVSIGGGLKFTKIQGNLIGTDVTGTIAIGNTRAGVEINGGTLNTIGGTTVGARNIISGNAPNPGGELGGGVWLSGSGNTTTNNTVQGNYIGTDITGNVALGNGAQGIFIDSAPNNHIGGTVAGAGNVISANQGGIMIFDASNGTTIEGNLIGTNAAGTAGLGNFNMGLWVAAQGVIIGGTTPGARNIISGNGLAHFGFGIYLNSDAENNVVQGNFIGTDITGKIAIGNDPGGIAIMRSSNNLIGGATPAARNIISGNAQVGVGIAGNGIPLDPPTSSDNNAIQGNYIGTDVTGKVAVPNLQIGIDVSDGFGFGVHNNIIGGANPGEGNLISGNGNINGNGGILIDNGAVGTLVQGNTIGLNANGTPLPNIPNGVMIYEAAANTIGGTTASAANVIAGNGKGVVVVQNTGSSLQNQILGNSIYSNTTMGIDLADDGVTLNDGFDVDTGPNNLQNFPTLLTAEVTSTTIQVTGVINTGTVFNYHLEFFANPVCSPSGYGEGKTYLGFTDLTTDVTGKAIFAVSFNASVPIGQFVTATATGPGQNTSEFSACIKVAAQASTTAAPVENYYRTTDVVVSWSSVSWATGYVVEWDDNNTFSSPTILPTVPLTDQSAVITVPGAGVYYWRVRALNDEGTMTDWSTAESFTVVLP